MTDIQAIVSFLKRTYPVPEVDPTWVRECVQALLDAGQPATTDEVHMQYLHSDLSASTLESRTFPTGAQELHDRIIFPRPTLLQLHAISEVGNSAFQIQTTMEARFEVLSGQSRIRRLDDEEEGGEEEADQGKVPPYPRSMLKLELGDGRRLTKAMEYKRIGELVLGQTSLGCKLLVQNVRCLRDTLLLTPENTQVLESSVEHLEALQKEQFLNDLKRRMGKVDPEENGGQQPRRRAVPAAVRPMQPPTSGHGQGRARAVPPAEQPQAGPSRVAQHRQKNMRTHKQEQDRNVETHSNYPLFNPPSSPPPVIRPTPSRHPDVKPSSRSRRRSTESLSPERPPSRLRKQARKSTRAAGKEASAKVQQLYHDIPDEPFDDGDDGEILSVDEFDYTIDESFIRHIDEAEARASGHGTSTDDGRRNNPSSSNVSTKSRIQNDVYDSNDDDDHDFMVLDELMIRQIDAAGSTQSELSKRSGGKGISTGRGGGRGQAHNVPKAQANYIDLDDEGYGDGDGDGAGYEEGDEDLFMDDIDESFIQHLDEVEAVRGNMGANTSTSGRSRSRPQVQTQAATSSHLHPTSSLSSRVGRGSQGKKEERENRYARTEVIEISD